MSEPDVLDQPWCCLACAAKFRFGQVIAADVIRCPKCWSADLHPAEQKTVELKEYHGEIGTKN